MYHNNIYFISKLTNRSKPKSSVSTKPTNKDAMLNASLVDRLTANDITMRTVTGVSNVALTVEVGHT